MEDAGDKRDDKPTLLERLSSFLTREPEDREELLDYLVSDEALDWASIHDPRYAERHTCTPILDTDTSDGRDVTDHWIVYGAFGREDNHQVFASKRLVIQPGVNPGVPSSGAAIFPSNVTAAFNITSGRPVRMKWKNASFKSLARAARPASISTSTPASLNRVNPRPAT